MVSEQLEVSKTRKSNNSVKRNMPWQHRRVRGVRNMQCLRREVTTVTTNLFYSALFRHAVVMLPRSPLLSHPH